MQKLAVAVGCLFASSCAPAIGLEAHEPALPDPPVIARVEPHGWAPERDTEPLSSAGVAKVGPRTSGGLADPWASPFVHFTRAMQPDATALTFETNPRIDGAVVWVDPYRAYFSPNTSLALGRTFSVRAHGKLVRDDGSALAIDESWTFETRPPSLQLEVAGYGSGDAGVEMTEDGTPITVERSEHWRVGVNVTSELGVSPRILERHIRARAWPVGSNEAAARPVPISVIKGTRSHGVHETIESPWSGSLHIHPRTRWPADHYVEVTVDGKYAPIGGGPIGKPVSSRFRVMRGNQYDVTCSEDFGDGCGPGGMFVKFTMPVPKKDLARVKVTPRPPNTTFHVFDETTVWIQGEFEIGKSYTVEVPRTLRDRVGQPTVGSLSTKLAFVSPPPDVTLVTTSGVLRSALPATVGLESRWTRKALLRAAVPSTKAWLALQGTDLDEAPFPTDVLELVEREIDLAPSGRYSWSSIALDVATLTKHRGPVLIEVVPGEVLDVARTRRAAKPTRGLFQVSEHGLAVWRSPAQTRVWVRDNSTLEPANGAKLEVVADDGKVIQRATTDRNGVAELLSQRALPATASLVVASSEAPAMLRIGEAREPSEWRDDGADRWLSSVVTERRLYRPGELVSVVGWAAISTTRNGHGLLRPKAGAPVVLELLDNHGEVITRKRVAMTKHGKYVGRLRLPATAPLGAWTVRATLPERGTGLAHMDEAKVEAYVELRDVEPPAFEVRTSLAKAHLLREANVEIVAHAGYYYGGAVPIIKHNGNSRCAETWATPAGLERGWTLLRGGRSDRETWGALETKVVAGVQGEIVATIATGGLPAGVDLACRTDLAIQDASFTEVGGSEAWYVHPSRYVFARMTQEATSQKVEVRAIEPIDHKRMAHRVTVEIHRLEDRRTRDGSTETKEVLVRRCQVDTKATGPDATCEVSGVEPGAYVTTLTAKVDGRDLLWNARWWASLPPKRALPTERRYLELLVEPEAPVPGDNVVVSVEGPPISGPGILAFEHGGLRELRPFELRDGSAKLELRASDAWVPGVTLDAFVVTKGTLPHEPPRVWRDSHSITVGSAHRRLAVTLDAPKTAGIGDEVSITVNVVGHDQKPIDGRVALWAVDEGIHALLEPVIPDLVATFAAGRNVETTLLETFSHVLEPYVVRPDPFEGGSYGSGYGNGSGSGGLGGRAGGAVTVIQPKSRKRFEATPIFVGDAAVERGVAVVRGRMPENLTSFRLTAIASAEVEAGPGLGRFGHADAQIQLTAPLVVRAAMPRMLRPGDEAELGLIVDNLAAGAGALEIEAKVVGGGEHFGLVGDRTQRIELAAGAQHRFAVRARAKSAGTAELEVRARLVGKATYSDAIRVSVPIETADPLRRHAAAYGSLATPQPFAVELAAPSNATKQPIRVDVELAGSLLGDLQPMARDLVEYPYGCVEQTSSGLLPLVALAGLDRRGYLDVEIDEHIQVGVTRLRSMQVGGTALGYWPGASAVHVWGSAYALWVLEALVDAGHPVPESLLVGIRDALMARLNAESVRLGDSGVDDVAATMVVSALASGGAKPTATIERLYLARETMPTFARALLLMAAHDVDPSGAIAKTLAKELRALVDEREGVASVRPTGGTYPEYFDSSGRTSAMVTLALQRAMPGDPVHEKLVRGLLDLRGANALVNTQERAYALLAIAEYARSNETIAPDLAAEVFIGGTAAGRASLVGLKAPVSRHRGRVERTPDERVVVRASGKGRLYYRVGMSWTPSDAGKAADSHGFAIERSMRVQRSTESTEAASEAFVAGDLVALDVEVMVDRTQRYVAIDVPIAPGFEPVDTSLGKGGSARVGTGGRARWVSHQELRRDRAVVFADVMPPGRHRTTIFLRAIAAGDYEVPPATVAAMYQPELQGNTPRARVRIAPRP